METVRLTTAAALVRYLIAQRIELDGAEAPLFPGVFAIFGHGNVTSLGLALQEAQDELPTWRGQNEQGMALAAVAYAKAMRRRQVMVATSSVGPGATNMVTAAAVALANRLPLLLLSGDTFASRLPDPVLQQVERFGDPSTTVNDAFRPVVRYWDRITRPEQLLQTLPQAVATLLDPADCGPAFLGLPQDVQAEAYDFPARFFEPVVHEIPRPRAPETQLRRAVELLRGARRPLLIAGGGVRYSRAEDELARFAEAHGVPVAETMAGKASLVDDHPALVGPIGVTGADPTNALAAEADVVLAVGTRLQDFTTGSWTVFRDEALRLVSLNVARHDAVKHLGTARAGRRPRDAARALRAARRLAHRRRLARPRGRGQRRAPRPPSRAAWPRRTARSRYVRAGRRRRQRAGHARRLRRGGGRRLPRRAERQLALARPLDVRLRVRLLVHGLRDLRRLGRAHGAAGRRGDRVRRRRLAT